MKEPRRRLHRSDVKLVIGGVASLVLLGLIAYSWVNQQPLQTNHVLILALLISSTVGVDILQGGKPPGN